MGAGKKSRGKKLPPPPSTPFAAPDDDGLVDDLLAQLDARDQDQKDAVQVNQEVLTNTVDTQTLSAKSRKDGRNRFKERGMRKAASRLAAYAPDDEAANERIRLETEAEENQIRSLCDEQALQIHEITPDGHCLFAAVADQLTILSLLPAHKATYQTTRQAAASYIALHPDDFLPFLVALNGEDDVNDQQPMTQEGLEKYCDTIRDTGAWGGEPEILALARAYNVTIHVFQGGSPPIVVHHPGSMAGMDDRHTAKPAVVRISYHRRMYGLGEHYNSLRPKA